jgi:hypothetical protein
LSAFVYFPLSSNVLLMLTSNCLVALLLSLLRTSLPYKRRTLRMVGSLTYACEWLIDTKMP